MPPVSQAQRKWAWANKDKSAAAAEYASADKGGKLPAHKDSVRGDIKEAMKKGRK